MSGFALALWALTFFPGVAATQTVKITEMTDISLGTYSGIGDLQNEDTICIYNLGNSAYRVRASGTGPGGAYQMTGPGGATLPFEVEFRSGAGSFVALTHNSFTGFTGADTSSNSCGGTPNATLRVIAREANLLSVVNGSYSGTLTILLETN
jgi:hypothetical protein